MGLRIRTNVQSLRTQRFMQSATQEIGKATTRLSSGHRINRAGDDAAGFAIAGVLSADVRSLAQARRNANDGISLVEVAEGGLAEVNNIMIRLRELSIQSASDTIGNRERQYLNQEFFQLKDEIERIALSTEFNGTRLLTGESELEDELAERHNASPLEVQIGKDYYLDADSLDQPNPINIIRVDLRQMNALTEGDGSLGLGKPNSDEGARIDAKEQAQLAIAKIDEAMEKVARYRSNLGAVQNRLEKTDRAIAIHTENLQTARSRIKDTDFASESANLTQWNILQRAASSVLSQANAQPQIALELLK